MPFLEANFSLHLQMQAIQRTYVLVTPLTGLKHLRWNGPRSTRQVSCLVRIARPPLESRPGDSSPMFSDWNSQPEGPGFESEPRYLSTNLDRQASGKRMA